MYFAGLINSYNSYQNDIRRFKFQATDFLERMNKDTVLDISIYEHTDPTDFILRIKLNYELSFEELLAFESEFHCRLKKLVRSKNVFCYCFVKCLKFEDII